MDDAAIKETLSAICQMLRDEIQHSLTVNTSMQALSKAVLEQNTDLAHAYEQQWRQISRGVPPSEKPPTHAHLQRLDDLIQKLKGL